MPTRIADPAVVDALLTRALNQNPTIWLLTRGAPGERTETMTDREQCKTHLQALFNRFGPDTVLALVGQLMPQPAPGAKTSHDLARELLILTAKPVTVAVSCYARGEQFCTAQGERGRYRLQLYHDRIVLEGRDGGLFEYLESEDAERERGEELPEEDDQDLFDDLGIGSKPV